MDVSRRKAHRKTHILLDLLLARAYIPHRHHLFGNRNESQNVIGPVRRFIVHIRDTRLSKGIIVAVKEKRIGLYCRRNCTMADKT